MDILVANSSFSDSECVDTTPIGTTIEVHTEVSTPREYIRHGENLHEHVLYLLDAAVTNGVCFLIAAALAAFSSSWAP